MEAKLIKQGDSHYTLHIVGHSLGLIPSAVYPWDITKSRLSLKNCQAIERGYDLDELAKNWVFELNGHKWSNNDDTAGDNYGSFMAGAKTILAIFMDKKFSEDDITKAYNKGQMLNIKGRLQTGKNYVKSLQQTEWDVIVETKKVIDETKIVGSVKGVKGSGNKINTYKSVPKLDDDDGCLILKRI